MRWAEPYWLVLLALAPLPWWLDRRRRAPAWPTLQGFEGAPGRLARGMWALPTTLRGLVIIGLVLALARPQTVGGRARVAGRGLAIVVALDQSSSMKAADFPTPGGPVSRLEAARRTVARFVEGRPDDLIGLVAFANYPTLACPPTLDHAFLLEALGSVRPAGAVDDGTNLGDGIVWGLQALKGLTPKGKVLVLLTDGRNSPAVPRPAEPKAAAALARGLGVTLHTIAVGKAEGEDGPDLGLLRTLAETGEGRAFVATDSDALERVFETINALEVGPVRGTVRTLYRERFAPFAAVALGLLLLDRALSAGRFRRLP